MAEDLYNARILEIAGSLNADDRLDAPDASVTVTSPLCGSRIKVDLTMEGNRITGYGHQVRACALGQSSAAIMAAHVVGETAEGMRDLRDQMQAMLKEDGRPPEGNWVDLEVLTPARGFRARHASILLPFNAVVQAIEQIETERDGKQEQTA